MQGHCNQNGYFGCVSGNLVSIQKSFYKLTAIPQAWHRIFFKSIFEKIAKLDKIRLTSKFFSNQRSILFFAKD
jgi:hypothetical protein